MRILILILSCLLFFSCRRAKENFSHIDKAIPVEITVIGNNSFSSQHTYSGSIEAIELTNLSFRMGGTLRYLNARVGKHTYKGEVLAVIDTTDAHNALVAARASLREAQDTYNRLKTVYDNKGINEAQWMEMQTKLDQAASIEAIAANELANCFIVAPFNGVVSACGVSVGETMLPVQPVMTISDMSSMQARFSIPESEWGNLTEGQTVAVEVPACNTTAAALIREKKPSANPLTHSYTVTARIRSTVNGLLPGMVCKIHCDIDSLQGLIVPANCIHTRPEGLALWKVSNGKAQRQIVKVREYVRNGVVASGGLSIGDTIITSGYQQLYENCPVRIKD